MKVRIGTCYELNLENGQQLDTTVYVARWCTRIHMSLWDEQRASALAFEQRIYLNYDRFLPMKWARKVARYLLNRHSQRIAGVDLIPKE